MLWQHGSMIGSPTMLEIKSLIIYFSSDYATHYPTQYAIIRLPSIPSICRGSIEAAHELVLFLFQST